MFENNNREIVRELAAEAFKSHKTRNGVAVLAIFLTTFLITAVLTVGISFVSTSLNAGEQTPGPESDGYLNGDYAVYEAASRQKEVEWVDYVRKCSTTVLHNDDFAGLDVRLFAPEASFYEHHHVNLKEGAYPSEAGEIMLSDTMSEKLGLKTGDSYTLQVVTLSQSQEIEREIPMVICGIYENPLFAIQSIYEEIYTGAPFVTEYNPELKEEENIIYIKLANLNPLLFKSDVGSKMAELCELTGAAGYSEGKNTADIQTLWVFVLPFFVFIALLMASGYFLIYNVFYISTTADIRWFGMMKTIGTTKRQIRKIMNWQVNRLAAAGIALGLAAGYLVALNIAPKVMAMTNWSVYYKAPGFIGVAAAAAAFAFVTVKISASKSNRLAARISPVQALTFTPKSKKYLFSVISLVLGGVLFMAVTNAVMGYQIEPYVARYNQNDYRIIQDAANYQGTEAYQPLTQQLVDNLKALPFVSKVDKIYRARTLDEVKENGYYPDSSGEIRPEGKVWDFYKKELDIENHPELGYMSSRGNLAIGIGGLPAERLTTEMPNYQILDGVVEQDKFSSGDYVIINQPDYSWMRNYFGIREGAGEKVEFKAGERLVISFYQESTGEYIEKELTVLAIIKSAHEYSSSDVGVMLILPDGLFKELYPNYEERISSLQITAAQELDAGQIEQIQNVLKKEHNTQLRTASRYEYRQTAYQNQWTYGAIGFLLASILAVIGISNVVNTVTAHVLAGKAEYATMQSIGMTNRQLFYNLLMEGLRFCLPAFVLIIPLGWLLSKLLAGSTSFTGFNLQLFIGTLAGVFAALVLLCLVLAEILKKVLNQKSVVERLRESE